MTVWNSLPTLIKMAPKTVPHPLSFAVKDDFRWDTLLYVGALFQAVLFAILPRHLAALPALAVLVYRVGLTILMHMGLIPDPLQQKATIGRTTAQVVNTNGTIPAQPADKQIVVFILASHTNKASTGRMMVPGGSEIGELFGNMWKELAADREKWGFLGKTSTLYASGDEHSNVTAWISYWRSLEDLHRFARGTSHTKGLQWWLKQDRSAIGVMHETFLVPAGHWETIYHNFRDFGLGQSKQPITLSAEDKAAGKPATTNGRFPISGPEWASMRTRMRLDPDGSFIKQYGEAKEV